MYTSTTGARVKHLRESMKLTQADIAKLTGISQQTISAIETGKVSLSRYLIDIADVFQCDPVWIKTGITKEERKEGAAQKEGSTQ